MASLTETQSIQQKKPNQKWLWLAGVGFTALIALIGTSLSFVPGVSRIGPMACSIILAVAYRQFLGYPNALQRGIHFSSHYLLRTAIILFGIRLDIHEILTNGLGLLGRNVGIIVAAIGLMLLFGKWLKADFGLSLLLGIGTGVCGAAAIATVVPILKAKEEDTALSVGMISLLGTAFALVYVFLRPILPISSNQYGMWSGMSLHEMAQVALAGGPAGPHALALALLAKLGRVLLLVPLSFLLIFWMNRKNKHSSAKKIGFPWFLLGFIAVSLINSFVFGHVIPVSTQFINQISFLSTFLLTMAMVGLGLKIDLAHIKNKALRPLAALFITSLIISTVSFLFFYL